MNDNDNIERITLKTVPAFAGIKIITSVHCYKTKYIMYGIADKRRPNNKKPLYVRREIHIPIARQVGDTLICHPAWLSNLRKKMAQQMQTSIDEMARNAFLGGAL